MTNDEKVPIARGRVVTPAFLQKAYICLDAGIANPFHFDVILIEKLILRLIEI